MKFKILLIFSCLLVGILTFGQPVKGDSEVNSSIYGGPFSIGVSIGAGGLLNIPMRVFITEKVPLEFSPGLRPIVTSDFSEFYMNISLIGGITVNFSKDYIASKDRVRMNGLFIKGGGSTGSHYNELIFGAGWSYERFKAINKKRSLNFELGFGLTRLHDKDVFGIDGIYTHGGEEYTYSPVIFWRIAWNLFSHNNF
jgi:hypothetical protein